MQMTASGEIAALTPERVWRETARALLEPHPEVFFEILGKCGALPVLMPELAALAGVPQPPQWHPEVDTFVHVMLALAVAAQCAAPLTVRYAVLLHDLGKALTPKDHWPAHHQHEELGIAPIETLSQRPARPERMSGACRADRAASHPRAPRALAARRDAHEAVRCHRCVPPPGAVRRTAAGLRM